MYEWGLRQPIKSMSEEERRRIAVHETGHAVDYNAAPGHESTGDAAFERARAADEKQLDPYLDQPGVAGEEETFAETFGRFYGGDPALKKDLPDLYDYWAKGAALRMIGARDGHG